MVGKRFEPVTSGFDWWGAKRRVQSEAQKPEPTQCVGNPVVGSTFRSSLEFGMVGKRFEPVTSGFDWWGAKRRVQVRYSGSFSRANKVGNSRRRLSNCTRFLQRPLVFDVRASDSNP